MESGGSGTEGGGSDEMERRQKAVEASFEDPVPDEGQRGERIKDQAVARGRLVRRWFWQEETKLSLARK